MVERETSKHASDRLQPYRDFLDDLRSVSNASEWWKGFNTPTLKRRCSTDWRRGFNDAREVERRLDAKATNGGQRYNPAL
jgi:hypothetical protein